VAKSGAAGTLNAAALVGWFLPRELRRLGRHRTFNAKGCSHAPVISLLDDDFE
jgi:hypothetical protein